MAREEQGGFAEAVLRITLAVAQAEQMLDVRGFRLAQRIKEEDAAGRHLVVPDLEAGNMLAKQLSFLANADAAGMVLGARVPIMLTSPADTVRARMASCAVAVLLAHARRQASALGAE
jgi:phosphate acetyltransferase